MTRLAWHFLNADGALRDGRVAPPDGEWLTHTGPLVPCQSGLHASESILDALWYAPGPIICRVELDGGREGACANRCDKLVAARRRILWRPRRGDERAGAASVRAVVRVAGDWPWDAPAVVREYLEADQAALAEVMLRLRRDGLRPDVAGQPSLRRAAGQRRARGRVVTFADWWVILCVLVGGVALIIERPPKPNDDEEEPRMSALLDLLHRWDEAETERCVASDPRTGKPTIPVRRSC